jgi:hypothetical protein
MTQSGDIRLRGRYVAGRDVHVHAQDEQPEPPFLIVDKEYLVEQAQKHKRRYVARAPDWADVVHGADPDLGFVERDQTVALHDAIMQELLEPCRRATDGFLHALVALGPPGAGKTTLVRRVAAMLVTQGECVVADFGVNTEALRAEEFDKYEAALERSVPEEVPLLVVVDDPFFANSGWVEFLRHLSRRHQNRIAVVTASPDFLFERFAHALFSRRVVGRTVAVVKPSERERRALALLYDRNPEDFAESEEDLLVVAMEAAAGESFSSITARMWTTLNNGVPLSSTVRHADLPWAVVAFAVVCYFHRSYVRCPEPVLRQALTNTLTSTPPEDLARELDMLVTREGWNIFSTRPTFVGGSAAATLIGATHARVAREALAHLPLRGLDVQRIIVDASVRTPDGTAQLAELILATQSSSAVTERRFVQRLATKWSVAATRGDIEARAASSLVRQLWPSRASRLRFRPVLRACLRIHDTQSWLIVWQLYQLAARGSSERQHLREVALPRSLKMADLSQGPEEAVEIAVQLGGSVKQLVVDRLVQALGGRHGWRPAAVQVAWLVRTLPRADVVGMLEKLQQWLDNGLVVETPVSQTLDAQVVVSLLRLIDGRPRLAPQVEQSIIEGAFDWMAAIEDQQQEVIVHAISLADACARSGNAAPAVQILEHASALLFACPTIEEDTWVRLVMVLREKPDLAPLARQIVPELAEWLLERTANSEGVWEGLFTLARLTPGLEDWAEEAVPRIVEWLLTLPECLNGAWSPLLRLVGQTPSLAPWAVETIPRIADWLLARDEGNDAVWPALLRHTAMLPGLISWTEGAAPRLVEWLKEHPEANQGTWGALLSLDGRSKGLREWVEQEIPEIMVWLRRRPEANEGIWTALIALVGRRKGWKTWAELEVPGILSWLRQRPEPNAGIWSALIALAARTSVVDATVSDAIDWLRNRPEANDPVWTALLAAVRKTSSAHLAEVVAQEALQRLRQRGLEARQAWMTLLKTAQTTPLSDSLADDIVTETVAWLRAHPEAGDPWWNALLALVESRQPRVIEISADTLLWLRDQRKADNSPAAELYKALVRGRGSADPTVSDVTRSG